MSRAESLIGIARADALRNVSRLRWGGLGAMLSIVPMINIILLGVGILVARHLTPTIDLSLPERLEHYFQNPASYTDVYCRTAKRRRETWVFYGWLAGVVISHLFK